MLNVLLIQPFEFSIELFYSLNLIQIFELIECT